MKPFKTLQEQIEHLEQNKCITFKNKADAEKALTNYNYYNIVSAAKVKFCYGVNNRKHQYTEVCFSDWYSYYKEDRRISNDITHILRDIELQLNSRLAYYLSKGVYQQHFGPIELKQIVDILKGVRETNVLSIKDLQCELWTTIVNCALGDMMKLIKILKKVQNNKFYQSNEQYKEATTYYRKVMSIPSVLKSNKTLSISELEFIKTLRNFLIHNHPLSVFLTTTKSGRGMTLRQMRIEKIESICKNYSIPEYNDIIINSLNFNKIKTT